MSWVPVYWVPVSWVPASRVPVSSSIIRVVVFVGLRDHIRIGTFTKNLTNGNIWRNEICYLTGTIFTNRVCRSPCRETVLFLLGYITEQSLYGSCVVAIYRFWVFQVLGGRFIQVPVYTSTEWSFYTGSLFEGLKWRLCTFSVFYVSYIFVVVIVAVYVPYLLKTRANTTTATIPNKTTTPNTQPRISTEKHILYIPPRFVSNWNPASSRSPIASLLVNESI